MDLHETQVHNTSEEQEVSAARRMLDGVGNFINDNKNKLFAAVGAVTLAITLAGCGVSAKEGGPEPTETSTSAGPTSESPAPVETTTPIEDMKMPESLKKYEAMSAAEFAALPIQERLTYISWLTRDESEIADLWYGESQKAEDKYPGDITPDSSNQDIVTSDDYAARDAFTTHFNVNGINDSTVVFDQETAQKVLSAAFADTSTDAYKNWTDALAKYYANNNGVIGNPHGLVTANALRGSIAEASDTESNHTVTFNGVEYPARTIPVLSGDKHMEITYIYVTYTKFDGTQTGKFVELKGSQ